MNKRWVALACICSGLLGACSSGGDDGQEPGLKTFQLTYCDSDLDCGTDFQCSPVYCTDRCMPDPSGRCLSCAEGHAGQCLPKPPTGCEACQAGEVCKTLCTGACDYATGVCEDVACKSVCVPDDDGCKTDADCGTGAHCEMACAKCGDPTGPGTDAGGAAFRAPEPGPMPKCPGGPCKGICVQDPVACNFDADCPEGSVCEPVMCPAMCAPDGKGGCLPCNGGKLGQCVRAPDDGCKSDAECGSGEVCRFECMGWCDAFAGEGAADIACKQDCRGRCVPVQVTCDLVKCPEGTVCQEVCSACVGQAAEKAMGEMDPSMPDQVPPPCGECIVQCVPVEPPPTSCDDNSDCPDGQHCEPVYCTMECKPDASGGCAPCNFGKLGQCVDDPVKGCHGDAECGPGQRCETLCMGACEPMGGCFEECFGQCVPIEKGCQSDLDCGKGQVCELMCAGTCPVPRGAGRRADPAFMPPGCEGECFGQCVDIVEPAKCNSNDDCQEGFVCEPVYCAMSDEKCIPDRKGGCGPMPPCNDGWIGECVPEPVQGCTDDSQCDPGEECRIQCMGGCAPGTGCTEACFGECVPREGGCGPDKPCPEGFECQEMCLDCAPGTDCFGGGCFGQCIPVAEQVKCNADAECGAGFHCELVFCTMECAAPADEAGVPYCPPCNDGYLGVCTPDASSGCHDDAECASGEVCQVLCTGVCDPNGGCREECAGVCVTKQQGCTSDAECGEGFACEMLCPPCGGGTPSGADPAFAPAPPCVDAECFGQCVPKTSTCGDGATCPPGQVCVEKSECPPCVYADPACMMPCKVVLECASVPDTGCKDDAACPEGTKCLFACPMMCGPEGCAEQCEGKCV